MIPITAKALATLVQLHGGDATIVSDNKGVDELLGTVRTQLESKTPPVRLANYPKNYPKTHREVIYQKVYTKVIAAQPPTTPKNPSGPPNPGGSSGGHSGGRR